MYNLLLTVLLLVLPGLSLAHVPAKRVWGSRIVGITVLPECPTAENTAAIEAEGARLGADYTHFLTPAGQDFCPAWLHGQVLPYLEEQTFRNGSTWRIFNGVTVGVHYRNEAD